MRIIIPALPHATLEEAQKSRAWIKEILSDSSPTEEVTLDLTTYLKDGETYIEGDDYTRRRAEDSKASNLLGLSHAIWLEAHQDEFPELMKSLVSEDACYIDFPGTLVLDDDGDGRFPYLARDSGRFTLPWGWTGLDLRRFVRVASRK